ncbi:signal peptide, CUB and EGF-like domain-containing protein 1 isoform X1 [Ciona intestinalis]
MRIMILQILLMFLAVEAVKRKRPSYNACRWRHGGCAQRCVSSGRTRSCACAPGFNITSNQRSCEDVDECASNNGGCQHTCVNKPGTYWCTCRRGYTLAPNARKCIPQVRNDACSRYGRRCEHFCVIRSSQPRCACRPGYRRHRNGRNCIRLCSNGNGGCDHICRTRTQSMMCACRPNYVLAADRRSCTGRSQHYKGFSKRRKRTAVAQSASCAVDNGGCSEECDSTPIGVQCSCPAGHVLETDRKSCRDINECLAENGGCQHGCRNNDGSFKCTCPTGFKLAADERTCDDIDECHLNDTCWHGCTNSIGSYECTCATGYMKYAIARCGDIDECTVSNGGCSHLCWNKPGSFTCSCRSGYKLHTNGKDCIREASCLNAHSDPPQQIASMKCVGKNCLFHCNDESNFRVFHRVRASYTYRCGKTLPQNPRARRGKRIPPTAVTTAGYPWHNRDLHINETLPLCPVVNMIKKYYRIRIPTDFCHLQHLPRSSVARISRVDGFKVGAVFMTCMPQKNRRRVRMKIIMEIEFLLPRTRFCNPPCNQTRINRAFNRMYGWIKRSMKKQSFHLSVQRSVLKLRKKSMSRGRPVPGIRSNSGCIVGLVGSHSAGTCRLCDAGTYYDVSNSSCTACPMHTYQENQGQLVCMDCPTSTSDVTAMTSATSFSQCPGLCPAGHFSVDGMQPCQACPRGTYQNDVGRIGCYTCGEGITTRQTGSRSFSDCLVRGSCTAGHYYDSRTGTCSRCPLGFYQPGTGQDFCITCPGNTTTDYDASTDVDSCKETRCGGVIENLHGVIESPNYPGNYPINSHCRWILKTPKKRKLLVVVPEIFLPFEDNCGDYLIMKSKETSSRVVFQSCQTSENPTVLMIKSKRLWIEFRSNGSNGAKGFQIPYVTYNQDYDKIIAEIVKDGLLYSADHHRNILKDKLTRQALLEVLADPGKYYPPNQKTKYFTKSFLDYLKNKVMNLLGG